MRLGGTAALRAGKEINSSPLVDPAVEIEEPSKCTR
jgi:hypothetical protein